jgi:hypothetical protein
MTKKKKINLFENLSYKQEFDSDSLYNFP